ncbi:hypothetical protein C8R46DRAFT_278256 [Mycena filopes]|nr:hypothetical protein C8R46DRAFT_278256 [Mycena filopes]
MHPHNARMRARLEQIHEEILLLQKEQSTIQGLLAAVTYPVLTLPPEITSIIFAECVADALSSADSQQPDPREAPLLLTYVCSAWRDIALSNTGLWDSIRTSLDGSSRALVETYLRRAGRRPLSLDIGSAGASESSMLLLRDLIRCSSQWREFDLNLPFHTMIAEFPRHMDLSTLETLSLSAFSSKRPRLPLAAFASAPKLRSVTLYNIIPSTITLPWTQLTQFHGFKISSQSCLEALRFASNLVQCAFLEIRSKGVSDDFLVSSPLPHLTSLSAGGHGFHKIWQYLTLPSLEHLALNGLPDSPNSQANFLHFLTRSPNITEVVCLLPVLIEMEDTFTRSFIRSMPKLTGLSLSTHLDQVLVILRDLRDVPTVLPSIQSLELNVVSDDIDDVPDVSTTLVYEALSRRWNCEASESATLLSFKLVCTELEDSDEHPEFSVDDRLLELRKQGMEVYIGTATTSWI